MTIRYSILRGLRIGRGRLDCDRGKVEEAAEDRGVWYEGSLWVDLVLGDTAECLRARSWLRLPRPVPGMAWEEEGSSLKV
jgi:hypothetical protein